jgi:HD-GYP domain-containing protein (c-di-GMP phosphodiesterase class II)
MGQGHTYQRPSGLTPLQHKELERFGRRMNNLGANFAVCSHDGTILLLCEDAEFKSPKKKLIEISSTLLAECPGPMDDLGKSDDRVQQFKGGNTVLAGTLMLSHHASGDRESRAVVLIDMGDASAQVTSGSHFGGRSHHYLQDQRIYLAEMLGSIIECFESLAKSEDRTDKLGIELTRVYEELVLLHKLSTNMKITETDANFLQMACDSLTEVITVEGIAVLLEKRVDEGKQLVVAAGSGLIDMEPQLASTIYSRMVTEVSEGQDALVDSEVLGSFKYDWPAGIRNIIVVPLFGKDNCESPFMHREERAHYIAGLMVAVNAKSKEDFDSTDIQLFNSVASGCAVFIENGCLFNDLSELFFGSLRALTDSIDAKDGYTHGHSERVAFISKWIAEHLAAQGLIRPDQVNQVHLSGLLHDIGKIGVDDQVLRKNGPLSAEEMDAIRKHPQIGAGILRGIKQMQEIVPGVLHHHEREDGSGYPHGLKGDEIPLLGKIVGLADSFDAITSRRSYRDARNMEQAIAEIKRCAGTQFDKQIAMIFLESDLERLWDIMQYGIGDRCSSTGTLDCSLAMGVY